MFDKINYKKYLTVLCLAMVSACSQLNKQPPAVSHDGLHLVPDTKLAEVYRAPDADFSQYQAAVLESCSIAFHKNWRRNQNASTRDVTKTVSKKDMESIQKKLSDSCTSHFKNEISQSSTLALVDNNSSTDKESLILRPSIIDLDINAPDNMSPGRSRTYTTSAGSMTLFLEIYDASTGDILARVVDRKKDPDNFRLEWTNSVTNKQAADRVLKRWASLLREGLDQAISNQ